jgi:hypothetical protein
VVVSTLGIVHGDGFGDGGADCSGFTGAAATGGRVRGASVRTVGRAAIGLGVTGTNAGGAAGASGAGEGTNDKRCCCGAGDTGVVVAGVVPAQVVHSWHCGCRSVCWHPTTRPTTNKPPVPIFHERLMRSSLSTVNRGPAIGASCTAREIYGASGKTRSQRLLSERDKAGLVGCSVKMGDSGTAIAFADLVLRAKDT